jgi:hypothetical protein
MSLVVVIPITAARNPCQFVISLKISPVSTQRLFRRRNSCRNTFKTSTIVGRSTRQWLPPLVPSSVRPGGEASVRLSRGSAALHTASRANRQSLDRERQRRRNRTPRGRLQWRAIAAGERAQAALDASWFVRYAHTSGREVCTFRCTFPVRFAPIGALHACHNVWLDRPLPRDGQS